MSQYDQEADAYVLQVLEQDIRRDVESLVIAGALSPSELKGLLPGFSVTWHKPRFTPPRLQPRVRC